MRNLATLLFLLVTLSSYAQRTISGVIKSDDNQERLPFADVVIKNTNTGASTNVDGYFALLNAPTDSFRLQIAYVGYATKEILVEAGTEDLTEFNIELSTGVLLDELVISGSTHKVLNASEGISAIQISPKQLSLLPNVGEVDIFRSLQLLPGVSASNENSSGLFVRGGTPDQNLVLLDGVTVYNVDHFFGFFSAFNADAIKDVQLFKGAFPAKYGGRLSGVVDLTGKTGNPSEFHGNVGINLLNARANLQIPLFNKGSLTISGRRSYTDLIQSQLFRDILGVFEDTEVPPDVDGLEINTTEPSVFFFDMNAKLSYNPTEKDVVAISFYNGADHLENFNDLNLERLNGALQFDIDIEETTDFGNRGGSAKWSRQWSPKWYSNLLVASSRYFSQFDRVTDVLVTAVEENREVADLQFVSKEDNEIRDLTLTLDNEVQLSAQHKLEFGALFTQAEVDYEFVRDDTLTILDVAQEASYFAGYVSDTWKPFDRLSLQAGVRATHYSITDEIYWSPRASFDLSLTERISLKGGVSRHFQFVNRIINENVTEGSRDFWLLADDDLVKVSNADHFIIGASYETDDYILDVEAYRKDFNNLAEFSLRFQRNDIDLDQLFFTGTGVAQGTEILLQKKRGDYTGWVAYTLARVRNTFPELNNGFSFAALHDVRHEFKTVHSYEIDNWRLSGTFVYASGRPFTEPAGQFSIDLLDGSSATFVNVGPRNGSRLPAYARLDLSAHLLHKAGPFEFDFGLSVFNLLNRTNVWFQQFNFTETPPVITEINYLGLTPNLSVEVRF